MGSTNHVHEYWKLATAIIPMMPAASCTQRLEKLMRNILRDCGSLLLPELACLGHCIGTNPEQNAQDNNCAPHEQRRPEQPFRRSPCSICLLRSSSPERQSMSTASTTPSCRGWEIPQ